jgi:hypothetical protein
MSTPVLRILTRYLSARLLIYIGIVPLTALL